MALKVIETNKPNPAHIREVVARGFLKTHGREKIEIALAEIKRREILKQKNN